MSGDKNLYIGTSGWTYDDWSGVFYPEDVKGSDRLIYYATQFNTVEVNATFYRLPTQAMLDAWNRNLKRGFHLVLKGSRRITHFQHLKNSKDSVELFFDRASQLKTLKVVLWQLPPSMEKDIVHLDAFLKILPKKKVRHAVEFRHPSWWEDEEVDAVLQRHKAAFVSVSHPRLPAEVRPTTDFLYLRFHGLGESLYMYDYSKKELNEWVQAVQPHLKGRRLYAFFNNDWDANAPKNAKTFRELLTAKK
jgi:uncharacterized protein YecE (DUF72 family)